MMKIYETPVMEILELYTDSPVLQGSGGGMDADIGDWDPIIDEGVAE